MASRRGKPRSKTFKHPISFLAAWREHKGLTQEELARRAGIGLATLVRAEQELGVYSEGKVYLLARALDLDRMALQYGRPPTIIENERRRLANPEE